MFTSMTSVHHVNKFYKNATVERFQEEGISGYTVKLDGRSSRTADGHKYFLPTETLAHLVSIEFLSQQDYIVSSSMPLVRSG